MKKDIAHKLLEEYPDVFADIINVTLFDGKEILHPENLIQIPTEAFTRNIDGSLRQGSRDVLMADVHGNRYRLICGEENQADKDNTMPQRIMGYEYAAYEKQIRDYVRENEDHKNHAFTKRIHEDQLLAPVITVVLYWGEEPWLRPLSLHDMLRFPADIEEEIKPYVADYPMNLIDMKRLPEKLRRKFKSDFRVVAEYMARQGDSKAVREYVRSDSTILSHPGAVLDLFGALTGKTDYKVIRETIEKKQKKEEAITMVYIEDVWLQEGMEKGMQQGENCFGRLNLCLLAENRYEDLKRASTDREYRHSLYHQYGIVAESV